MIAERQSIELDGCSPQPLGSYLKALGVFRIIAEQADLGAESHWTSDRFYISTILTADDLIDFLAEKFQPTPILAPWNGSSGFYPKDNKEALDWIRRSESIRLTSYRETLSIADRLMATINSKPSKNDKEQLLQACRAMLPDRAVDWLDAAYVLGTETPRYPPLLGTGGNDGHLEFTNNFMQRLAEVMDGAGKPSEASRTWLRSSLFGDIRPGLIQGIPIGQFDPAGAGGANTSTGFEGKSLVNPWDYILTIEGSLFFASGVVRRGETNLHGELSYPFSVKSTAVGYGSASKADSINARAELWAPLWGMPARYTELRALFSEGRSNVEGRKAVDGLDFVRAVATLGVDRGIDSFQRYGFLERNGRAFFAVPLGRYRVSRNAQADLLASIDDWLSNFRFKASDEKAPASIERTLKQVENATLQLCVEKSPRSVESMIIALGECERALCVSSKWAEEQRIRPVPALPAEWLLMGNDGTSEFRMAAAIALVSAERNRSEVVLPTMRESVEPVILSRRPNGTLVSWNENRDLPTMGHRPIELLNDLMKERIKEHVKAGADSYLDRSPIKASLTDISAFLDGRLDEGRIARLFWGLVLLDPLSSVEMKDKGTSVEDNPGAAYSILKLCHVWNLARIIGRDDLSQLPLVPEIHRRAACGDLEGSSILASRRLRGSRFEPKISTIRMSPEQSARVAAALLVPLNEQSVRIIAKNALLEMEK